jgi:hypothetical protein
MSEKLPVISGKDFIKLLESIGLVLQELTAHIIG